MSFSAPNYTQTPNELFALLADMKEAELRVTLVIVRATFGWNAGGQLAHLTGKMLEAETGLSKQGVLNGVKAGKERGTILTFTQGKEVYYGLSVTPDGAAAANAKGQLSRPKLITLDGQPSRPIGKAEGQRSGPKRSTTLTQTVNLVDSDGQPSRPSTPVFPAPSGEETGAQRQLKDIKDNERQTAAGEDTPAPAVAAAVSDDQKTGEGQPSGADRTGTPDGVNPANAMTGHGRTPVQANGGAGQATTPEKVPAAARGAALAALQSALRPMNAQELIDELPSRQHWQDIPAERIRAMHDDFRTRLGTKRFRGDLIDALDREARQLATPTPTTAPTTQAAASDRVRALIGRKP